MSDITHILQAIDQGDAGASAQLSPLIVYLALQKWTFARARLKTALGES